MKQMLKQFYRKTSGSRGLLVIAVTLLLTLGITSPFANAQDVVGSSSFSNLSLVPDDHNGGGNRLEDLLDGIIDLDETLADALGITVEELEAAREAGTSLDELIDELDLDSDTVHQAVQDAIEAAVEQAVEDGLLTEEEAEAILNPPTPPNGDTPPPDGNGNGSTFSSPLPGPGGPHGDTPPTDDNGETAPDKGSDSATDNSPGTDSGTPDRPEHGPQGGNSQGDGPQGGGPQSGGAQGGGENRGGRR